MAETKKRTAKGEGRKPPRSRRTESPNRPRKPGRPKGSIRRLTDHERRLLLSAIESGATDHAAARMIDIDPRTFRRWRRIADGGDPDREPDEYLTTLFKEIEAAKARARVKGELEVARRDPKYWLRHQAPSQPGLPGWTAPIEEEPDDDAKPIYAPTVEEIAETIHILINSGAVPSPFATGD